jgi:phosphate-selective porin OprO/OprP
MTRSATDIVRYATAILAALAVTPAAVHAEEAPSPAFSSPWSSFSYGEKGIQYGNPDDDSFLWFGVRLQTRMSNSRVTQEEEPGAPISESSSIAVNRGRLKLGGHLFTSDFQVYSEYDLVGTRMLDLRATYRFTDWLSVRIGQWKSPFNRERIDSSGAQQFVERSVATPWFTIDRQQGIVASGRLGRESRADTSYWFGWLSGAGRGGRLSDADGLWLARAQWNPHGRVLGFGQSALARPTSPLSSVALATVTGRSAFTAFSSAGGGQLPGFSQGERDQYELQQIMFETAFQYRGLSWQQELHWKSVEDRETQTRQRLFGGYAQLGAFLSEYIDGFPRPLEIAARYGRVDPNRSRSRDAEIEYVLGANWFFNGHRNKLTLDLAHVKRRAAPETDSTARVRLQWDWSF